MGELLHIQANRYGKLLEVSILKGMLVVEDVIVHLPELALSGGSLSSESGVQRVGVNLGEWKVAKDKTQLVPKLLLQSTARRASIGGYRGIRSRRTALA